MLSDGLIFTFLGLGFIIIGIASMRALRRYFITFFYRYRKPLRGACIILSLATLMRGIFDLIRGSMNVFDFNLGDEFVHPVSRVYIRWCTEVFFKQFVILTQLASLVFGSIRKKNQEDKIRHGQKSVAETDSKALSSRDF